MSRKTLKEQFGDAYLVASAAQALAEAAVAADLPYGVVARALRDAMRAAQRTTDGARREQQRVRAIATDAAATAATVNGMLQQSIGLMDAMDEALTFVKQQRELVDRQRADRAALLDGWDLSVRAANTCQAMGLRTVADLVLHSPTTLRAAGMAIKVIRELQGHLAKRGRTLRVEAAGDEMILRGAVS